MGDLPQPVIGSEALASGALTRYELRRYYRAIMPNVYLDERVQPSLHQRTVAAWLWSGREAGIRTRGVGAARCEVDDDDSPVELIWGNARSPNGAVTRDQLFSRMRFNDSTAFA